VSLTDNPAGVPLEPLLPLFHRLNREHFQDALAPAGVPLVAVRWSDGRMRRSAGIYRFGRHADGRELSEIVLSRPLLEPLPRQALLGTLCHEMIHAYTHRVLQVREVHGPHFRARMAAINAAQAEFVVSVRHRYPLPGQSAAGPPPARWLARCPRCGVAAPYRRRVKGLACRACCERHNGGLWHASCLLEFVAASDTS
jgi:predicted SprT family Zn-dependent metalloprotease